VQLAKNVAPVYIKSTDGAKSRALTNQLLASGNTPAGAPSGANAVLQLSEVKYRRDIRTVDTRGKVTGYTLVYTVNFNVTDKGGETLLANQQVSQQRDYNFDNTQVLAKESEETYLRENMEKDVALQIIRQLAAISK